MDARFLRGWISGRRARPACDKPRARLSPELLDILRCPSTGLPLRWTADGRRLEAVGGRRFYAVRDGIPDCVQALEQLAGDADRNFASRYDQMIRSPRMEGLYGASGHFNVGYWHAGTDDIVAACKQLVNEVAARVPSGARRILDVGCGVGAGTSQLIAAHPEAMVIGVNLSHWQLRQAQQRGLRYALMSNATRLAIASDSIDAVVAIESAQHFVTRRDFFAEAFRVLRPGGVLTLADMLFAETEVAGSWMLTERNRVADIGHYRSQLEEEGFVQTIVSDCRSECWTPYCAALRNVYPDDPGFVDDLESSLGSYVLAEAIKPSS